MEKILQSDYFKKTMSLGFMIYIMFLMKFVAFKYSLSMTKIILREWSLNSLYHHIQVANYEPFYTILEYINGYVYSSIGTLTVFKNLIGNIVVFIPLGFLLPALFKKYRCFTKTAIVSFICILGIETSQLITTLGIFDVDDILLNMFGAILGYLMYKIVIAPIVEQ